MNKIDNFIGEYFFLSNFYPVKVTFEGLTYDNSESAFQAMKCIIPENRNNFVGLDPSTAKKRGRTVHLRYDWEEVKEKYMYQIVKAKFEQNLNLKLKLLDTGNAELIEGNNWGDKIWGKCNKTKSGQNKLGKILMKVREELREG